MNNPFKGALFFIMGAASASFITYKLVEKKFKDIADEEIKSVKEMYERKLKKVELDKNEEAKQDNPYFTQILPLDKESLETKTGEPSASWPKQNPYSSLVNDLGYSNKKEEDEKVDMDSNPNVQVIPPEDFGEYGYKCESLTYYADKVLTLDDDTKITAVNNFVGPDALNTFGEYEDDSVFVRNHDMKTDFEILLDSRRYVDVVGTDE